MRLRLVVSDVDGTLVDDDKKLSAATMDAVARLQAAGVPFTIISARPPSGIAWLVDKLHPTGPIAAFNGGTIIAPDGAVLKRRTLDRAAVEKSFAIAQGSGADPWLFADARWHVTTTANPHVPHEIVSAAQQPIVIDDMAPLFGSVDKLTWVSDDHALLDRLQAAMREAIGDSATIALSQPYYLDLTAPQANKGDGVALLAQAAGVALSDVAVIGDQHNDVPMLERAGIAIAMGQAPETVKAVANHVTTDNNADGVAHAIDAILLPMIREQA